jgi:acyl-CoA thioesterase FadM
MTRIAELKTLGFMSAMSTRRGIEAQEARSPWARFVEVYKAGDEKPCAQIKSNWVLLDAQTRRLKRVPLEMAARFMRDQNAG